MSKPTEGPWTLKQEPRWPFTLITEAADGTVVAVSELTSVSTADKTTAAANAREGNAEVIANETLRAAAPELFEALTEVMMWIKNWTPNFVWDDEWDATEDKVTAALAKARPAGLLTEGGSK